MNVEGNFVLRLNDHDRFVVDGMRDAKLVKDVGTPVGEIGDDRVAVKNVLDNLLVDVVHALQFIHAQRFEAGFIASGLDGSLVNRQKVFAERHDHKTKFVADFWHFKLSR